MKPKKLDKPARRGRRIIPEGQEAAIADVDFDIELANALCAEIETAQVGMRRICARPGMPTIGRVKRWLREWPEFQAKYARAKQEQAEMMAEDILDIADDGRNDTFETADGNTITDTDVIQRSKLRVDARKWLAAKLLPKKYGEVPANGPSVTVGVSVTVMSDEKRQRLIDLKRQANADNKVGLS